METSVKKYLTEIRPSVAPSTLNRKLACYRKFGSYLGFPGFLHDYMAPRPAKLVPHPLPNLANDVMELLEIARTPRKVALIALCGLVGLRISEALSVDASNVDPREMIVTVRGKGDAYRVIPLSQRAWDCIAAAYYAAAASKGNKRLVNYSDRYARRLIKNMGAEAILAREIASHDLRMTFGTEAYNKSKDLRAVQELLGHANASTTEGYIGKSMDEMRAAANFI